MSFVFGLFMQKLEALVVVQLRQRMMLHLPKLERPMLDHHFVAKFLGSAVAFISCENYLMFVQLLSVALTLTGDIKGH